MSILVGYLPDKGGRAALDLGAQLARSGTVEPLVVATVVPQPWSTPSMARVDAEFADWSRQQGEVAANRAREHLAIAAPDLEVDVRAVPGRSIPRTLVAQAQETGCDLIVLGSSPDGALGQVVIGATADPLLHSSPMPVAVAPRGYRNAAGGTVGRITFSYAATDDCAGMLDATAGWARRLGVPLRIATFGVRGRTMYPPEIGFGAEDAVLDQWTAQVLQAQERAVQDLAAHGRLPDGTTTALGTGRGWSEAVDEIDWEPGEILVVGSSSQGPLARVFLGSKALKIVRHAPVPVLVVPDAVAAQEVLAEGP
ncbi:universal stress protein [Nakamurella alba]|uniref:universal stress protein n=1 Tax=Nakamurella alba TaxID=2665158 RepID=UPI0018AC2E20|nr:universal stress protein [Nakamurella alba]